MKIAIIGGRIKGIEIAVLAKLAGIHSVLIDKDKLTPASGLCEENYVFDVTEKLPALLGVLKNVDIVIPALEDKAALLSIEEMCRDIDISVAFDFMAFDITNNKIQMDLLIREEGFPHLKYYPDANPPFILKPFEGNKRKLIRKVNTVEEVEFLMSRKESPETWIAQEYIPDPIYSIEIIGREGEYKAYEVSELSLTSGFDDNMTTCPCSLDKKYKDELAEYALAIAEKLRLTGIVKVKALLDDNKMKIVDISADFPTQSPICIFYSTGVNLLIEFLKVFLDEADYDNLTSVVNDPFDKEKYVVRKNFKFINKNPVFCGEDDFEIAGPLKLTLDLFDACYAITDYIDDDHEWMASFINVADTEDELLKLRIKARESLLQHCRRQL